MTLNAKNLYSRPFRIEQTSEFEAPVASSEHGFSSSAVETILMEIRELRHLVKPAGRVMVDIVDAYRHEIAEVLKLRTDLQDIQHSIQNTRKEMASLHVGAPSTVGMDQLSDELGAVVTQTAAAAHTIMTAAEAIGLQLNTVRTQIDSGANVNANLDKMDVEVSKLFEACHFQDLTGQRIERVCDTLAFIELQIGRLTDIWGGLQSLDHLLEIETKAKAAKESSIGDHALANGPKLMIEEIGHVNQLEIDSLFN